MAKSKTMVCDEDKCVDYMKKSCPFSACGVPMHGCEYVKYKKDIELEEREEGWGDTWGT